MYVSVGSWLRHSNAAGIAFASIHASSTHAQAHTHADKQLVIQYTSVARHCASSARVSSIFLLQIFVDDCQHPTSPRLSTRVPHLVGLQHNSACPHTQCVAGHCGQRARPRLLGGLCPSGPTAISRRGAACALAGWERDCCGVCACVCAVPCRAHKAAAGWWWLCSHVITTPFPLSPHLLPFLHHRWTGPCHQQPASSAARSLLPAVSNYENVDCPSAAPLYIQRPINLPSSRD